MLDGLLGRSAFSSKCKSLIKPTRTRIEALRRRAEAKQRFLKEDLAKLLANGLDVNAYGRTEEFISGLNLLSCYTFIDQSCEYIYKHLSIMQKLGGQCPEDCRETVASLMFGAARFYDLPELRDLRDVFQNRYGNGFECFVNPVFVDKLASKPPVLEKRIKLLHDIAAEFSIHWDSNGFKQRMDKAPSTLAKNQTKKPGPLSVTDDKYKLPNGNNLFRKNDYCSKEKERIEHGHHGATLHNNGNGNGNGNVEVFVGRENKHHKERIDHHHHDGNANVSRKEVFVVREEKHSGKEDNDGYFSNAKKVFAHENHDRKERNGYKQESFSSSSSRAESIKTTRDNNDGHLFRARQDMISSNDRTDNEKTMYNGKSQGISNENVEDDVKKLHEEEASRFKSHYNNYLPPPYVKSSIPPAPYSKPQNSERMKKEADNDIIPLPKPRSIRRKHRSKSSSSHDEDVGTSEDAAAARIVKRISSSRRKERKRLQVLFDDQHYHHHKDKDQDQEEKMMDKLLLHYSSKKPSSASAYDDMAKLRKKKSNDEVEMIVPPMRSISLPHEPSGELEPEKKVYARANSFHPDNQAKHVHPKLPDYDDLAARFAAMRGR